MKMSSWIRSSARWFAGPRLRAMVPLVACLPLLASCKSTGRSVSSTGISGISDRIATSIESTLSRAPGLSIAIAVLVALGVFYVLSHRWTRRHHRNGSDLAYANRTPVATAAGGDSDVNTMQDGVRLCTRYARTYWYVPIMLTVSLIFNIIALSTDFLTFSMWLHDPLVYGLPHLVWMMWTDQLYVIALLILFFSIIFPLFKLSIMFIVWFRVRTIHRQEKLYHLVQNLGKWSFMDIFIVSLLLAMTNDQAAVSAVPQVGVYFFIAAIVISMLTSELIHSILRRTALEIGSTLEPDRPDRRTCPLFTLRWFGWFIGVLLIGSLITLFASIGLPFLKINQFMLSSNSYNIFETIKAVFSQHQYIVGIMLAIFLILFPTVRVLVTILLWFSACSLRRRLYWIRKVNIIARWSMIDVFGLSLVLIILEGHDLIRTDVKAGTYLLVIAIVLTVVLPFLAMQIDPVKRLNDDEDDA